jgi:hypothetical protein
MRHSHESEVQMSTTPSHKRLDLGDSLPFEPSNEERPHIDPADVDQFTDVTTLGKRTWLTYACFLIAVGIGVAVTLAWQSYGDAARAKIANSYPQLGWLAPQAETVAQNASETVALAAPAAPSLDQQRLDAMSFDLEGMRQSVDRIATSIAAIQEQMSRSADRIATEQMAHSVAELTAGQAQMTREITKLQAVEQYVLYKSAEPVPRPALAPPGRNQVARPSQAR